VPGAARRGGGGIAAVPAALGSAETAALDARLITAHAGGDTDALVGLYAEAGHRAVRAGAPDAAAFYMTQAYVYALDRGDARAARLRSWLVRAGRET